MAELSGWAFPVAVDEATGRIKMTTDNDCVRQNIRLIVQTDRGERKMRPTSAQDLTGSYFKTSIWLLVNRMSETIAQSIRLWEEHLRGVNVGVMQSQQDYAAVNVNIEYITDLFPGRTERITQEIELNQTAL